MGIILAEYQYDIVYRKSRDHANCDCLSRLPIENTEYTDDEEEYEFVSFLDEIPLNNKDFAQATRKDVLLCKVYDCIQNGWPNRVTDNELKPFFNRRNELSVEQGVILWGLRVVIPAKYRQRLMAELHEEHTGMCRMKNLARSYMWWPNLDRDIEETVKSCSVCQLTRNVPTVAPLHPWKWATRPWQRIHIDYGVFKEQSFLIVT